MKTHFTLISLAIVIVVLLGSSQNTLAQWTTNGNNINNTNSGNVGVGTTTPDTWAKLHVYRADGAGIDIQSANAGQWSRLRLVTGTHTYGWFAGDSTNPDAANKIGLYDYTTNAFRLMIDSSGNIGIGTSNPGRKLEVLAADGEAVRLYRNASTPGWGVNMKFAFNNSNGTPIDYAGVHGLIANATAGAEAGDLLLTTATSGTLTEKVRVTAAGNVGIGTATPNSQYKLDVAGNINSSGTITGNNIVAKYQDVAEWVPANHAIPAGTVVTLDPTRSNHVEASSKAYDTRVAGVISAQPGIALGTSDEGKVLVATTGRVRVKVDASRGSIQVGDLLVSSDTAGVAMKSQPINIGGVELHRPGTLIGKALEPLQNGTGEILVLLSLQ